MRILLRVLALFSFFSVFAGEELKNASFSQSTNGVLADWISLYPAIPYSIATDADGNKIVCGESSAKGGFALKQVVKYNKPNKDTVYFRGYSKAENVSGKYSLTLDIVFDDGTMTYLRKSWEPGTHDYQMIKACFRPKKAIKEIRFYILLRNGSGKACFRNISLMRGKVLPPATRTITFEQEASNNLFNPSLEIIDGKEIKKWDIYNPKNPYSVRADESNTLRVCGKSTLDSAFGLRQIIAYSQPSLKPINFSGWSKALNIERGTEYRIFMDILHRDGSWTYSIKSDWNKDTKDWQNTSFSYRPKKQVARIYYYILLRKGNGMALFRNMSLTRGEPKLQFHYSSVFSMGPYQNDSYRIRYAFLQENIKSNYQLLDSAGRILYSGSAVGKKVDQTVKCPGSPIKLQISADDDKTSCSKIISISRISAPKQLANGKNIQVWLTDSMTKVSPLTFPPTQVPAKAKIALAGGERECVQLSISNVSNEKLGNISVEITNLKNNSGKNLPGKIICERIAYVPRAVNCNSHKDALPDSIYWLPDPLLPNGNFSVPAGATQGVWITVAANRNIPRGTWHGFITVKGLPQKEVKVPFEVTTWGFSLPERFSYRSAFAVMDGYLAMQYPEQKLSQIRRKAWNIMLDHRLNPDDITRTELPKIEDLLYARSRGMNYFTICNLVPKPKGKKIWTLAAPVQAYNDELIQEFQSRFDPYVAELKKHGLDKDAAFYGFDERGEEYFPSIAKIHKMLKTRYKIPLFSTSAMYRLLAASPERSDCYAQDWYCPTTMHYKKELSDKLRHKGHQVWWYTCCGPYYPYANFSNIEYPLHDGRLLAWMTYYNQADGFLFWHTNNWLRNTKRFNENTTYQPEFNLFIIGGSAGDGQLLYPGQNGPLPSIRLANLRDGSEDYDYLKLLEAKKGMQAALTIAKELVPDVCKYETNHSKIMIVREKIAKSICY